MDAATLIAELRTHASPKNVAGMARYGIRPQNALGISMPTLRKMARRHPNDHALARDLWACGIHEARILATLVEDPARVTPAQMDRWTRSFDTWDVCDQACMNLYDKTPYAWTKAREWTKREREYEKRAGYSLIASLASHDKKATNARFRSTFPAIRRGARDERNYVKKAVSWALRGIGKRNDVLLDAALIEAHELAGSTSASVRWVGRDAVKELEARRRSS